MNRAEIRQVFRDGNPDLPVRVLSDTVLNNWCLLADQEICAETRCIVTNESVTFDSVASAWYYDLSSKVTNFYEIDDFPGGGVYYNDDPLTKITPGRMNTIDSTWKSRSNGTPTRYWRRGQYLWLDRPTEADVEMAVDAYLYPDDFDSDEKTPYDGLTHLIPFHEAIVRYLEWRGKQKIKDPEASAIAYANYIAYRKDMKKKVRGYQQGHSQMRIKAYV